MCPLAHSRRLPPRIRGLGAAAAVLLLPMTPEAGTAQLTEPLSPCSLDGFDGPARCGSLEVAEDPDRPEGRRISIRVAVLPSRGDGSGETPLAVLAGGPGQAGTDLAGFAAATFDGVRDERDILLVDTRGTGGSNPLDCPSFSEPTSPGEHMGPLLAPERVRPCRRALSQRADLGLYTTRLIADDLVRVWRAMGHDRVDVYGTSYGTRVALELMRRHPRRLRSAVLKGVAPLELRMPLNYPRDGQRSLERIMEHCRAEAECRRAYPRLEVELVEVLAALDEGVDVLLAHPASGDTATVRVRRDPVTQALMAALQGTASAVYVPRMIHAAARGEWAPLASFALFYRVSLAGALHEGMFLSVTCAEDLPFIDSGVAEREAEDTFLGVARYADQSAACKVWNVPAVDPAFRVPVRASVPTLLISGNYDPVTPPRWGWKAAARLDEAFHLVVPEGSHSFSGMAGCVDLVIARFIQRGQIPTETDPCLDEVGLGDFSLPDDPWPPIIQAPGGSPGGG